MSKATAPVRSSSEKEQEYMKTLRDDRGKIDSAKMAVLFGLSIGMGIAVHPAFFLLTAFILLGLLTTKLVHAVHKHAEQTRLAYRAR